MKRTTIIALMSALMLIFSTGIFLTSCGIGDEADTEEEILYQMNEGEDGVQTATVDKKTADKAKKLNENEENFYGTWVAYGGDAENLYGNLEVTINEDGTVKILVTDEKDAGTWEKIDGGISYTAELMSGKIYYGPTCTMVIENEGISVPMKQQ